MKNLYNILVFLFISLASTCHSYIIIFDFGGVFIGKKNTTWTQDFLIDSLDISFDKYQKIIKKNGIEKSHSLSGKKFWLSYAESNGYDVSEKWLSSMEHAIMKDILGANRNMYELLGTLQKDSIPCYLLSNMEKSLTNLIKKEGLFDPFNLCFLSCEIGIKKPDLNAFTYVLDKTKANPQDVIFIDDLKSNIEAANSLGMHGILFTSEYQLRNELKKINILKE